MVTVGVSAARARFNQLLDRVAAGERITITRRGKPVAMLVPPATQDSSNVAAVVREMLAVRNEQGPTLGGNLSTRLLIEQGRRG